MVTGESLDSLKNVRSEMKTDRFALRFIFTSNWARNVMNQKHFRID